MKKFLFLFALFVSLQVFPQGNNYWLKFKNKQHNQCSLNSPLQFLSQKSIDRRSKQGISLDTTDLPITKEYEDSVTPFINRIVHRLKWSNLFVVNMDNALAIHTDTVVARRDTIIQGGMDSTTYYDTLIVYIHAGGVNKKVVYDTTYIAVGATVHDTFPHITTFIHDSIVLTDIVTGNNFDSLKRFSFIDSVAGIEYFPSRALHDKFADEQVYPVDQHLVYPNNYGAAYHQIQMLNGDLLHQMGYRGEGIIIAMMDNGPLHADTIRAFDSVRQRILLTWDFVHNHSDVYHDDGGHATYTFSCIAANIPGKFLGTAPDASFYLFHTEDNDAEWVMEEYNWAAAAEMADSGGAQIFTTSLGYTEFDNGTGSHTYTDLKGDKTVITHAGNLAFAKGILVLNSAGNDGAHPWHYIAAPADGDSIMAVGAVDSSEKIASFSSRGPNAAGREKPDVCAQGVSPGLITPFGNIVTGSGTSFSCPITAGCAASLWSAFPEKSAREIYDAIVISADRFWTPSDSFGYGIPNFYNAYLLLKINYNGNILRISDDAVVFPNPFGNELNVALFNSENKNRTIEIFNLLGQKVYTTEIFIRDKTFEIVKLDDIRGLSSGEYFLKIDGEKQLTHSIIKAK